jgi:hypothetical protein
MMSKYKRCPECGERFDNVFDAIDHITDAEELEPFDPSLILSGGYSLMIGSMLKDIFNLANERNYNKIILMVEAAYLTLYTAEKNVGLINEAVEDMQVKHVMEDFDVELKELLNDAQEDGR